ncbi:MAG: flagellar basal-body rod protein FlgG [Calditrichaeota bacterium]|nr:flagellar basal-body rod protein FlgG [Calditrichota bacterium]
MIRALRSAASGMYAQQLYIDTIANNLSNVNTTGFKRAKMEFQDLVYQTIQGSGNSAELDAVLPTELQIGHGVRPISIQKSFEQGNILPTGNPLDLSIDGEGFFQVGKPDGTTVYSRDGSLKISPDGGIVTSDGYRIEPTITIPADTAQIMIARDGTVSIVLIGETEPQTIGQIELARFINPAGLHSLGQNLYKETVASGPPILGNPGQEGMGMVSQGFLESSNVQIVEEMVAMIVAQRAYEVASKAIRTAEEMLTIANNLKR